MANGQERWRARPLAATLVRIIAFGVPFVAGVVVSQAFVRLIDRPAGVGVWPWRLVVVGIAVIAAVAIDPLARRLVPLAALLQMSLLFPDRAPSRLGLSAKVGSAHDLNRLLAVDTTNHDATRAAYHVLMLIAALSRHDRITRGHSERVRGYARLIAEELDLSPRDADRLQWAALLHDVGKLRIDPEILNKRGGLTPAEWAQIRTHPNAGAELVAPLAEWLGEWAQTVAHHHERFDGTGYPNGLRADDISLGGRVVAVIDAYDVMTAARSYKRAISSRQAREELRRCAGGHFDPDVVDAFMNISRARVRFAAGPLAGIAQLSMVSSAAQTVAAVGTTVSTGAIPALTALAVGTVLTTTPAAATTTTAKPGAAITATTVRPAGPTRTPPGSTPLGETAKTSAPSANANPNATAKTSAPNANANPNATAKATTPKATATGPVPNANANPRATAPVPNANANPRATATVPVPNANANPRATATAPVPNANANPKATATAPAPNATPKGH